MREYIAMYNHVKWIEGTENNWLISHKLKSQKISLIYKIKYFYCEN